MEISKAQLRRLTDGRSWERGVGYHKQGNVLTLLEDKDVIVAKVAGTHNYKVKLWLEDGQLDGQCSCPMGDAGVFCKHCVAVGLTYLDGGVKSVDKSTSGRGRKKSKPAITLNDVRKYLSQQKTDMLVEMIMTQVMEDDRLREKLMMKAARFDQKGLNINAFYEAINQATNTHGFVDYYSAHDFAKGIDNAVDSIEELLTDGYAGEVIELAEHTMGRVEEALNEVDDSDGDIGDILEQLQEIHYKACVKAKPNPEALAKRLFEWELTTDWDTFYEAAETYADVLGKKGLAAYRELAEAEWAKMPQLKSGQRENHYYGHRFRLTSIMESLACVADDIEALVAIKSRDLSSAYKYLQIAEIYKEAKKSDKALEWAEKGLKAFPKDTDRRLREFLANEYHRRKRHNEAMELIWANFLDRPGLEGYKVLKTHAGRIKQWPEWQQRALEHIRAKAAETKKQKDRWYANRDSSLLVEIFLWEKDVEAAWQQAQASGCVDYLWMELAKLREKEHPADAISIYKPWIEPMIQRTNNNAYREAIGLIRKVHQLMKRVGQDNEFQEYISSLRTKYVRKRNFIAMLKKLK